MNYYPNSGQHVFMDGLGTLWRGLAQLNESVLNNQELNGKPQVDVQYGKAKKYTFSFLDYFHFELCNVFNDETTSDCSWDQNESKLGLDNFATFFEGLKKRNAFSSKFNSQRIKMIEADGKGHIL